MKNLTILLVEDSEDDVFLMHRALSPLQGDWRIELARHGKEAIDYIEAALADSERFPMPDLIFLDLKMPYKSGMDVLKWMREKDLSATTFVVVLTSSEEPRDVKMAHDLGARSYLVKPPTTDQIRSILNSLNLGSRLIVTTAAVLLAIGNA